MAWQEDKPKSWQTRNLQTYNIQHRRLQTYNIKQNKSNVKKLKLRNPWYLLYILLLIVKLVYYQ